MSTKHPFFFHGAQTQSGADRQAGGSVPPKDVSGSRAASHAGERAPEPDDAACGHKREPRPENPGFDQGASAQFAPRNSAKGHAAYAAREGEDEMPPFTPRGTGIGPLGGLFAEDSADQAEHGAHGRENNDPARISDQDLLAECRLRVCPECPVRKEAEETRLRSLAELDNARKRLARERDDQMRFASEAVLGDILPSLDNLDLALRHAATDAVCKNFVVGVEMTRKLLFEALSKHGLELVGAVGEEFDPARHEAVGMTDAPDVPEGYVCGLFSCGYRLHDRLLRPARVMVCKRA